MVIGVLMAALALNWSFLVLVQRDMQWRGQAIGLAAAPALLDEALLRDETPDLSDDLIAAVTAADLYRQLNNDAVGARLQLSAADLLVDAGYVSDVTATIGPGNEFEPTEPYNTLRVQILRDSAGGNPVEPLVNGHWNADPVDVMATSYVTLDNRLVGWRPTATANAPLLPISVLAADWAARAVGGDDNFPSPGGNDIRELQVRLDSSDPMAADGNAAMVSLDPSQSVSFIKVLDQISEGAATADLAGGQFGPATIASPLEVFAESETASQASTTALVGKLNEQLGECRVLLLHQPSAAAGKIDIVGFAGVRIMEAVDEEPGSEHRLRLTVEPCFVVHHTAWTDPAAAENTWIHKLRVRR